MAGRHVVCLLQPQYTPIGRSGLHGSGQIRPRAAKLFSRCWLVPGNTEKKGRGVGKSGSATGEDGTEACIGQDACDSVAVITLNLDSSFFHGASGTTGLLHFFRQPLFLRLADTDKSCDYRHRLPTPVRGRTNDIHPPTGSFWCSWCPIGKIAGRWLR